MDEINRKTVHRVVETDKTGRKTGKYEQNI